MRRVESGLMGEASNWGLELLQLTCREKWADGWAELVKGGNIPNRGSSMCKDPK